MSFHTKLRLETVRGRLREIMETDQPLLQDSYYIEDDEIEVDGMGTLDNSMTFCEDCANQIKDDASVDGYCGVGTDAHCSLCDQPVFFLVSDEWIADALSKYTEGLLPEKYTSPEDLYSLELALERQVAHLSFSSNHDELATLLSFIEDSITSYIKGLPEVQSPTG